MTPLLVALMLGAMGPRLEAYGGAAISAPTRITLKLDGRDSVSQEAHWDNKPLIMPVYWLYRLSWDFGTWELGIELNHHKIYLTNPQPPIERFNISHGFNIGLASVAYEFNEGLLVRAGLGFVIGHPESTIAGQPHGDVDWEGYGLSGPAAGLALERRLRLYKWVQVVLGVAGSAAWVSVPVAGGRAELSDFSFHARLGLTIGPQ